MKNITPGVASTRIDINADLSATELEALIRRLAMARAGMQPAVPAAPGNGQGGSQPRTIENATAMGIERPDAAGEVVWNLRSEGLGWIAWRLAPAHIAGWVEYLAAHQYLPVPDSLGKEDARH
jgi:hypothetical protein